MLNLMDRQIAEIRKAVGEADAGDFATPADMARVAKKWTRGTASEPTL